MVSATVTATLRTKTDPRLAIARAMVQAPLLLLADEPVASLDPATAADVLRARSDVDQAVAGLRRSGNMDDLPLGLLTRAWLRCLLDARSGSDSAQADLDEAWAIAERGPMRLFLADIHLHRARLFHAATPYPWDSPRADLAAARELIEQCGYGRRLEELADAEAALGCART